MTLLSYGNVEFCFFSEEKLSVVTSELESLREASLNSASGEASNLSFELTEADL